MRRIPMIMKHCLLTIYCFFIFTFSFGQESVKKMPVTITKHQISFSDDYPWMENMKDKEVGDWVDAQNERFKTHLDQSGKTLLVVVGQAFPALPVAESAPSVMPWKALVNETT